MEGEREERERDREREDLEGESDVIIFYLIKKGQRGS